MSEKAREVLKKLNKYFKSGGYYVGINYIEFKPQNIKPTEDNSSAVLSEKESAKTSLSAYANAAYEQADEVHPHFRSFGSQQR